MDFLYPEIFLIQLDMFLFLLNLKHISACIEFIKISVVWRKTIKNENDKFENADQLQDFLPENVLIFKTEAKIFCKVGT